MLRRGRTARCRSPTVLHGRFWDQIIPRQRHFPAANTLIWIKSTGSIAIHTDITPVIPSRRPQLLNPLTEAEIRDFPRSETVT